MRERERAKKGKRDRKRETVTAIAIVRIGRKKASTIKTPTESGVCVYICYIQCHLAQSKAKCEKCLFVVCIFFSLSLYTSVSCSLLVLLGPVPFGFFGCPFITVGVCMYVCMI